MLHCIHKGLSLVDQARKAGPIPYPRIIMPMLDVLRKAIRSALAAHVADDELSATTEEALRCLVQLVALEVGLKSQDEDHPSVCLIDTRGTTEESRAQVRTLLLSCTTQAAHYSRRLAASIRNQEAQLETQKRLAAAEAEGKRQAEKKAADEAAAAWARLPWYKKLAARWRRFYFGA